MGSIRARSVRDWRREMLGLLSALAALALPAQTRSRSEHDTIPAVMQGLVVDAERQHRSEIVLHGARFHVVDAQPRLVWPATADTSGLVEDREKIRAWLVEAGPALGFGVLRPRFLRASQVRGGRVWDYELEHDGVALLDYRLRVFWDGGRCVGLSDDVPRPVISVERARRGDRLAAIRAYFAQRGTAGSSLVLATLERASTNGEAITVVRTAAGVAYRECEAGSGAIRPLAASFSSYPVPGGVGLDRIVADSTGRLWFTAGDNLGDNDKVYCFDPATTGFRTYPIDAPGLAYPDGIAVDDRDRVWVGIAGATPGTLWVHRPDGVIHVGHWTQNATLEHPVPTRHGTIWAISHLGSAFEFDVSGAPLQTVTPTSSPAKYGVVDPVSGTLWLLLANGSLAEKPAGGPLQEKPTPFPGNRPLFHVHHEGKVYYSSDGQFVEYDSTNGQFTKWRRPGQTSGSIAVAPNGKIVFGDPAMAHQSGKIVVFDPDPTSADRFTEYTIPMGRVYQDGLIVAPDGTVWFTDKDHTKIWKLVLP